MRLEGLLKLLVGVGELSLIKTHLWSITPLELKHVSQWVRFGSWMLGLWSPLIVQANCFWGKRILPWLWLWASRCSSVRLESLLARPVIAFCLLWLCLWSVKWSLSLRLSKGVWGYKVSLLFSGQGCERKGLKASLLFQGCKRNGSGFKLKEERNGKVNHRLIRREASCCARLASINYSDTKRSNDGCWLHSVICEKDSTNQRTRKWTAQFLLQC